MWHRRPRPQGRRPSLLTAHRAPTPASGVTAIPASLASSTPSTHVRTIREDPLATAGCSARPATGPAARMSRPAAARSPVCSTSAPRRSPRSRSKTPAVSPAMHRMRHTIGRRALMRPTMSHARAVTSCTRPKIRCVPQRANRGLHHLSPSAACGAQQAFAPSAARGQDGLHLMPFAAWLDGAGAARQEHRQ